MLTFVVKKIKIYLLSLVVLLVPGCIYKKINVEKEFNQLNHNVIGQTGNDLNWQLVDCPGNNLDNKICDMLKNGLSRKDAVKIAIWNNKKIQILLEDLGTARSDLNQAGKFTNPYISSTIQFTPPFIIDVEHDAEFDILFSLDDLWQIPLKQRAMSDRLCGSIYEINKEILEIIKSTENAYDRLLILLVKARFNNIILEDTQTILKLEKQKKVKKVEEVEALELEIAAKTIKNLELTTETDNAYIALKLILGLSQFCDNFKLTDKLKYIKFNLISNEELMNIALANRPELKLLDYKIKEIYDLIKLEEAKLFKNVKFGVAIEDIKFDTSDRVQFGNIVNIGPALFMDIPVFDQNQAQVSRHMYLLEKTKKEFYLKKLEIEAEVFRLNSNLNRINKTIDIYRNNTMPRSKASYNKVLKDAKEASKKANTKAKNFSALQLKNLLARNIYYKQKLEFLDIILQSYELYSLLEFTIGKKLNTFVNCESKV